MPWLFIDGDYTWTRARTSDAPEGAFYIPLAPVHTAAGGITVQKNDFSGSLRARWLGDRPANEDYSLTAKGYLVIDAQLNYSPTLAKGRRPLEWTLSVTNLANTAWKETQFETTSRLRDEAEPVTEIHFTPGAPFWLKSGITFKF
jgi:outer membrane receptor protein involved in Fe transport